MKRSARSFLIIAGVIAAFTARAVTEYVDDQQLRSMLQRHLERQNESSNKVAVATLRSQLSRTNTTLKVVRPSSREREWPDVYSRVRDSVFIIGEIYKCTKCKLWHVSTASAFAVSADGALVTNFHVVNEGEGQVMGAMNMNGEFFPITEVLAASKEEDIAIVRAEGGKFQPLPLQASKQVGSPIAVLSHPDRSFYSLTSGMISRYSSSKARRGSSERRHTMTITADYAKGSSGAPVFDLSGNVVGLASSTESVYYEEDHGEQRNLQQVFKLCVPASCVLDLISAP